MAIVAELFISFFFEVICYAIGRFLIPILSFGTARAEGIKDAFKSTSTIYTRKENVIVLSEMVTALIGLIALIVFGILAHFFNKL